MTIEESDILPSFRSLKKDTAIVFYLMLSSFNSFLVGTLTRLCVGSECWYCIPTSPDVHKLVRNIVCMKLLIIISSPKPTFNYERGGNCRPRP